MKCETCKTDFETSDTWKTLCTSCYKISKGFGKPNSVHLDELIVTQEAKDKLIENKKIIMEAFLIKHEASLHYFVKESIEKQLDYLLSNVPVL